MGEIKKLPFSPQKVHDCSNNKLLVIDVDGGMTWVTKDLDDFSETKFPFPAPISNSLVCENQFFGFWIDHELLTARFARIDLDDSIENGKSRAELRIGMNSQNNNSHVESAIWSHAMTAELLAMSELDGIICFVLWKRGVYAVSQDSKEIWRVESLTWEEISHLPRSEEIISVNSCEEKFVIWSRGGGWAMVSPENGSIIESGVVDIPQQIDKVFFNSKSGWLLICGNDALMFDDFQKEPTLARFKNPVNHAIWDEEISSWRTTGWRMDAVVGTEIQYNERSEIGVHIGRYRDEWYVLDNSGNWSPHIVV